MRQLDAEGRRDEAIAWAVAAQRDAPGLAVGVALARWFLDQGDRDAAGKVLSFAATSTAFPTNEWALAREAAQLLDSAGRPNRAVDLWRTLLASQPLPADLRLAWLPDALRVARAAGDNPQAVAWQAELAALAAAAEKK
jgi:hypothetical protein